MIDLIVACEQKYSPKVEIRIRQGASRTGERTSSANVVCTGNHYTFRANDAAPLISDRIAVSDAKPGSVLNNVDAATNGNIPDIQDFISPHSKNQLIL
jgi:hypothetical protein